jgi:hypothetical protein
LEYQCSSFCMDLVAVGKGSASLREHAPQVTMGVELNNDDYWPYGRREAGFQPEYMLSSETGVSYMSTFRTYKYTVSSVVAL